MQSVLLLITREGKASRQVHLRNREQRRNLLQCFRQEVRNWEINPKFYFQERADPSNLGRSLLEVSQTRSELMRQEHQVGSLNDCISERQQQACAQRLELQDASP